MRCYNSREFAAKLCYVGSVVIMWYIYFRLTLRRHYECWCRIFVTLCSLWWTATIFWAKKFLIMSCFTTCYCCLKYVPKTSTGISICVNASQSFMNLVMQPVQFW